MPIVVAPIPGAFAREVVGVDCSAPLTDEDISGIDAAMDRHAVLVFRSQPLTDEQQLAFTRQFGELERYETPGHIRKREEERLAGGIADFSNLTRDGKDHVPGGPRLALQACRPAVALRQFVPSRPGQIFPAVGAHDPVARRRYRLR